MTRMIVSGCLGRLGSAICRLAEADADLEVVAGIDVAAPPSPLPYPLYKDVSACFESADVYVLCASPHVLDSILKQARHCATMQIPLVLCTTGLPDDRLEMIKKTAGSNAVLVSANMSLGINLLTKIIHDAAKLLYEANFDIEIIERHHNQKLDAPSGTAYMLAEAAKGAVDTKMRYMTGRSTTREFVFGQTPVNKLRERNEIGIHSVRGGTITGDHSVIFAGLDEVIELKHSALSRDVFAVGALKAAKFMHGKPPGLYTMQDVVS